MRPLAGGCPSVSSMAGRSGTDRGRPSGGTGHGQTANPCGRSDAARLPIVRRDRGRPCASRTRRTVAADRERPRTVADCPARLSGEIAADYPNRRPSGGKSPQAAHRNATGGAARSGRARTRPAQADAMAGGCGAFPAIAPAPCPARSRQTVRTCHRSEPVRQNPNRKPYPRAVRRRDCPARLKRHGGRTRRGCRIVSTRIKSRCKGTASRNAARLSGANGCRRSGTPANGCGEIATGGVQADGEPLRQIGRGAVAG